MRVVSINICGDPAAVGQYLVKALQARGHAARHIMGNCAYQVSEYRDIVIEPYRIDEIKGIVDSADVLHFNQCDWTHPQFEPFKNCIHAGQRVLFHGHGGAWLLNPDPQVERCNEMGAGLVVCSPMDPAAVGPTAKWIPNIMPFDAVRTPDWNRDFSGELVVGQAPNHSGGTYKGAEMVRYMVEHLGAKGHGFPVRLEIVTRMQIDRAIEKRRAHHFTVDNWVQGFTGMQGFEGLALGHVVLARLDPLTVEGWASFAPEMIPIKNIKGFDTCAKAVREYCNDRDALLNDSLAGRAWLERWYNPGRIFDMWLDYYESLEPIR